MRSSVTARYLCRAYSAVSSLLMSTEVLFIP
jgi:hypothetical protein